jgi:signal peptidase
MAASFVGIGTEVRTVGSTVRTVRRLARLAAALVKWALVAAAAAAALMLVVLPRLGLYRSLTVLSGSMVPTFRPGDVILVRAEPIRDLRVGQVITYQVPVGARQIESHRVVKILSGRGTDHPVVQTKGDANTGIDPWNAQLNGPTVWHLELVVPKVGYAINALRSRSFHLVSVGLAPLFLALAVLARLWGFPRPRDAHA